MCSNVLVTVTNLTFLDPLGTFFGFAVGQLRLIFSIDLDSCSCSCLVRFCMIDLLYDKHPPSSTRFNAAALIKKLGVFLQ